MKNILLKLSLIAILSLLMARNCMSQTGYQIHSITKAGPHASKQCQVFNGRYYWATEDVNVGTQKFYAMSYPSQNVFNVLNTFTFHDQTNLGRFDRFEANAGRDIAFACSKGVSIFSETQLLWTHVTLPDVGSDNDFLTASGSIDFWYENLHWVNNTDYVVTGQIGTTNRIYQVGPTGIVDSAYTVGEHFKSVKTPSGVYCVTWSTSNNTIAVHEFVPSVGLLLRYTGNAPTVTQLNSIDAVRQTGTGIDVYVNSGYPGADKNQVFSYILVTGYAGSTTYPLDITKVMQMQPMEYIYSTAAAALFVMRADGTLMKVSSSGTTEVMTVDAIATKTPKMEITSGRIVVAYERSIDHKIHYKFYDFNLGLVGDNVSGEQASVEDMAVFDGSTFIIVGQHYLSGFAYPQPTLQHRLACTLPCYGINVAVRKLPSDLGITLGPNPVLDELILNESVERIEIITLQGLTVREMTDTYTVPFGDLPTGMYMLKIQQDGEEAVTKIIKK